MTFNEKRILGKTGLKVGRLGISSSFGAPVEAYEEAFEKGCNYFTWGTFIKGRSSEMKKAIKTISQTMFVQQGVTTVHEMGGQSQSVRIYQELISNNELPLRIRLYPVVPRQIGIDCLRPGHPLRHSYSRSPLIR